jgi:hypothetical protein
MPVFYEIDKASNLIRTRCVGQVTLLEVLDHFRDLEQDPDCPQYLDVMLDLTGTETVPSHAQLRSVSDQIRRVRGTVQFGICAIVTGSDAVYGSAMVFEVLAALSFRVTKVFQDGPDAENWLAWQRSLAG